MVEHFGTKLYNCFHVAYKARTAQNAQYGAVDAEENKINGHYKVRTIYSPHFFRKFDWGVLTLYAVREYIYIYADSKSCSDVTTISDKVVAALLFICAQ